MFKLFFCILLAKDCIYLTASNICKGVELLPAEVQVGKTGVPGIIISEAHQREKK